MSAAHTALYRFVALVWDRTDQQARFTAAFLSQRLRASCPDWVGAVDVDGLAVFHTSPLRGACQTRVLPESAGVVLGRVFSRDGREAAHPTEIVRSGGRCLLDRHWGRYVAIVREVETESVCVLRDPSGGLPAFMMHHNGVQVVFSDLADCLSAGVPRPTVSWTYLARFIAHSGLQVRETALHEVTEILPGERVCFKGSKLTRAIEWNPIELARRDPLEDTDAAVEQIRLTTRACVGAWARCYQGIVHNLSGGLDSSIVLSCLKHLGLEQPITCVHYFTTGPNEDERKYARLMASSAGVELIERQLDPTAVRLEKLLDLRDCARPWFFLYELEHGDFESAVASERGADGLFSGAGGDGVFFQAGAELAVTDYLFEHGFGRGLMRTSIDAARIARKSIWPLLGGALRSRLIPRAWDPTAMAAPLPRTLVSEATLVAARNDREFIHPWFAPQATRGVPPGILWHASSIHVPPAYYSSFAANVSAERSFPLLSQPLVELCLRIPTYVLIRSGRDRALARRAFARDLPEEIVHRRTKGRIDQHVRNILDVNLPFVREMLLDGWLVREGILDRRNLETYLTRERSPADFQYSEILQVHLCAEAWVRRWATRSCGSADSACDPPGRRSPDHIRAPLPGC